MAREPSYQRFEAKEPDGRSRKVEFVKAGILTQGDRPELYFFQVADREAVVGISGEALERFQRARRYLSREEKIDLAGLHLRRQIEAGRALVSEYLYIRDEELAGLSRDLGLDL